MANCYGRRSSQTTLRNSITTGTVHLLQVTKRCCGEGGMKKSISTHSHGGGEASRKRPQNWQGVLKDAPNGGKLK